MNVTYSKYPNLKKFLQAFAENITTVLQIRSIILFGGITLDDFSKRYSDIDIIVVLDKGLDERELAVIDEVIIKLRKLNPEFTHIMYIYFLPVNMLDSLRTKLITENGLILGNQKKRTINQFPLSILDNFSIRKKGKILFGEDLKNSFPSPPKDCFWTMFINSFPYIEEAVKRHPFQYSSLQNEISTVSWLLYFPRMIYSLKKEDIIGKSDSAYWFLEEYNGSLGKFLVEVAKCRQEDRSLKNVKNIVRNSRKLLIYALERAFEVNKIEIPDLNNFVNIELEKVDFHAIFKELKKFV